MSDFAPGLERLFPPVHPEFRAEIALPPALAGRLSGTGYWNGPGRFEHGALKYRHWLDGDGLVLALTFGSTRARVVSRFVRSAKWVDEERAGGPVYRTFGTAFSGDRLKRAVGLESPANVSVYPVGATLLAFGEQGLPYELDPVTLETRGLWTFGGQLNELTPFSAHPKFDPERGEMFAFGVSFSATSPLLNVFRFDAAGGLVYRRRLPLPFPCSMHDFALSRSYAVFQASPYLLDMAALRQRGATVMDALTWQPDLGSRLLIVRRADGEMVATLAAGNAYCLHLVNAFEDAGLLVVDLIEYERPLYDQYQVVPDLFSDVSAGIPVRYAIDLTTGRIVGRRTLDYDCAPDFPAHDASLTGRPCGEYWMLGIRAAGQTGRKFFDQLVHANWADDHVDVYQAPPGQYLGGEPLVMPADTGGPLIVCHGFVPARHACAVLVFDGRRVADGPIAELELPQPIPALFHSGYRPRAAGEPW